LLLDNDNDKKTILVKDREGRLPIHCACETNAPVEVIQLLLESDVDKKSILVKDKIGQLPIHCAYGEDGNVEAVQLLMQASIGDRIEQLGLQQWRIGIEELINTMRQEDSTREKLTKVRQIYTRLSNYEENEPAISLLALAIWRTSCLKWGDIQFKSIQDMDDLRVMDETFDPVEYKNERRIKSGADVIIRGVLPFLPVDDDSDGSDLFSRR
jgi:ankyrin repeat protein